MVCAWTWAVRVYGYDVCVEVAPFLFQLEYAWVLLGQLIIKEFPIVLIIGGASVKYNGVDHKGPYLNHAEPTGHAAFENVSQ